MNLSFENKNKVENGDFVVNGQRQPNFSRDIADKKND